MRQERWAAFEEFARVNGDGLVRLSFTLCGDRGKAEDAAQEALTGVYLRWGRLDDPLPYARRAVVNATNDQWRRLSRRERRERTAAVVPPESPAPLDDVAARAGRTAAGRAPAPATASPGTASPATTAPTIGTAAYVTKHIEAALANASRYLIRTEQSGQGRAQTIWTDPRTNSDYQVPGDGPGTSASWITTAAAGSDRPWRGTDVDYTQGTWSVYSVSLDPSAGVPGGSPRQLAQAIKQGFYKIDGRDEVNGHPAIKLFHNWGTFTETIWIDAGTYQPVRYVRVFFAGRDTKTVAATLTVNESWGPRTPSLVKLVNNPVIPAGYKEVPAA